MARNGELDTRTLVRVDGWALLAPATAASWVAACDEMVTLGYSRPTITAPDGAYRDLPGQKYWKAYWTARGKPGNAAWPGTSNHGWGTAVDIFNVYRFYRPDLLRVFAKYGFTFDVPSELWHARHNGSWPANTTPASAGGHIPIEEEVEEEEDDMALTLIAPYSNTRPDQMQAARGIVGPGTGFIFSNEPDYIAVTDTLKLDRKVVSIIGSKGMTDAAALALMTRVVNIMKQASSQTPITTAKLQQILAGFAQTK